MLDNVKVKILNKDIKELPNFSTDGSAGLDLRAAINASIKIQPNTTELIPTGYLSI